MAAAAAGGDGEAAVMRAEVAALRLRVQELERENQRLGKIASRCTCGSSKDDSAASSPVVSESLSSSKQEPQKNVKSHCRGCQVGVVSHCPKRLIALKIMYFGQRFYGFASEAHTEPTVESEIFKALERAKLLVGSRKESCYSRCGRTDKGVSATGQEMQKAALKFIGEHDYRNFCKMDAANIVDSLLDITKTPRKPQYKMASEIPLILRSCLFDEVNFMCSSEASQALIEHLKDEYHQYMLQAAIFCEALSCLCSPEPDPFEPRHKKRNHIPLMSRQTEHLILFDSYITDMSRCFAYVRNFRHDM
ncbi:Os03g0381100 [Oryza sativa Japonica Group]|uniref:Os03g0381100 protein n=1 Tax=Oryza sativa subsp. japonica TaxID=39947 RepID=Q0DRI5_ORYSJ|nr:Os03g0381100 [Oryza sativa Japonica Group]|eukprot:NP_001050239.2 Os03g0381100 [Oryza sativa Japonica Group]